jgi:hypothetical protein
LLKLKFKNNPCEAVFGIMNILPFGHKTPPRYPVGMVQTTFTVLLEGSIALMIVVLA